MPGVAGQFLLPLVQAEGEQATSPLLAAADPRYSNYIVYVDESGDHGLESVDPNYPVFVLALCVFHKGHYAQHVVPAIEPFKFRHFGHDVVILHEHDIRKEKGHFRFSDRLEKTIFLDELTGIIESHNFILISCVIDKTRLKEKAQTADNPYHLALAFCLETLFELMQEKKQDNVATHVVVECRGKKEDRDLRWNSGGSATTQTAGAGNFPSPSSLRTKRPTHLACNWLTSLRGPSGYLYFARIIPIAHSTCCSENSSASKAGVNWVSTMKAGA